MLILLFFQIASDSADFRLGLRENAKYAAGVLTNDRTIEIRVPPITAIASGCNICDPAHHATASGRVPATVADAVNRSYLLLPA